MKQQAILLICLFSLSLAQGPPYWISTIPNGNNMGNPPVREFQTVTNVPGTSVNVLFGGVTYNGTTSNLNDTWILTTGSTSSWKLANPHPSPQPRAYSLAGATATEVILFGGSDEKVPKTFFNDIWRYSVSTNMWTEDKFTVPSILLARYFHAGALVGDTLFIFGGFVNAVQNVTNDVWAYNITSKAWSLRSANGRAGAPKPRQGHTGVAFNDTTYGPSIIFFGGYNGTGGMSDTWQFVINTSNWIQLTKDNDPLGPSPRWAHSSFLAYMPTRMIVFGGSFVGGPINPYYNDVWSLAQVTAGGNTFWNWTMLLPDGDNEGPWKRGGHSTVISGGSSYTFGGYGLFVGLYNDVWQLLGY